MEEPTEQAGADHLGRLAASEVERGAAETIRDDPSRQQVAREIEHVAQVVAPADRADRLVENDLQVLGAQAMRARDPDVVVDVLAQRRCDHAVRQRLDDEVLGLVSEVESGPLCDGPAVAQQLVSDVERRVRPARLRQHLDHGRDAVVAVDEDDVALADVPAQRMRVVHPTKLVAGDRLVEERQDSVDGPAAEVHGSRFGSPPVGAERVGARVVQVREKATNSIAPLGAVVYP